MKSKIHEHPTDNLIVSKLKHNFAILFVFSLFVSCTPDADDAPLAENLMTLKKSITYTPQETNFNQKSVKYFNNNKVVVDSTFNNLNQFTSRLVYSYTSTNTTKITYNSTNSQLRKVIYNYDNIHRLTSVNIYDATNQLTNSTTFTYQNENIFMNVTNNGVTTPKYHYKTNSDGYLYYEVDLPNDNHLRTIDYVGAQPSILHYGIENYNAAYNYYPQIKPSNMQHSAIETNNMALGNFFMEHVHFFCNYYLKELVFHIGNEPFSIQREYQFNDNNYETYLKVYSLDANGQHNSSETFTFYN